MITVADLRAIFPDPRVDAERWTPALAGAMQEFGISTTMRAAAFLAQLGHESRGLTRFEENLHYSAQRLVQVWPKRFTRALAEVYARQPERIANYVYANRNGNGNEASGDGWKYRGRGPIQLTFKDNYSDAGEALNQPLVEQPDLALTPAIGARIAGWYWHSRNLNPLADAGNTVAITRAINGGTLGLEDRKALYDKALRVLVA